MTTLCSQTRELQPHQQRVVEERKELRDKAAKLNNFINSEDFNSVVPNAVDQMLLITQFQVMVSYDHILTQRINRF